MRFFEERLLSLYDLNKIKQTITVSATTRHSRRTVQLNSDIDLNEKRARDHGK